MAGPEARLTTCFRDPHRCRFPRRVQHQPYEVNDAAPLELSPGVWEPPPEPWAGTGLPRKGSARPDLAPNWDIGAGRGPPRPLTLNRRHDRGAAIGRLTSKRRRGCGLHPGREAAEPGMRLRRRGGRIPHVHPLPVRTDFFRQCPFAWFGSSARRRPRQTSSPSRSPTGVSCRSPDDKSWEEFRQAAGPSGRLGQDRQGLQEGRPAVPQLRLRADAARPAVPGRPRCAHHPADRRQGPSPACESSGSAATGPFGSGPGPAEGAVLRRTVTNGITSESPSTLLPAGRQHHGRTTGRKIGPKLFG